MTYGELSEAIGGIVDIASLLEELADTPRDVRPRQHVTPGLKQDVLGRIDALRIELDSLAQALGGA